MVAFSMLLASCTGGMSQDDVDAAVEQAVEDALANAATNTKIAGASTQVSTATILWGTDRVRCLH